MLARDVMTYNPISCIFYDTAQKAAQVMKEHHIGVVPVIESACNTKLVGVVTDRDLALKVVAAGLNPSETRLTECMSRQLVCCLETDSTKHVMDAMVEHEVRRIPVVDEHRNIVGIISFSDLVSKSNVTELISVDRKRSA